MAEEILVLEQQINNFLKQAFPLFAGAFEETGLQYYKNKKTQKNTIVKKRSISHAIAKEAGLIRVVRGRWGGVKLQDAALSFLNFTPNQVAAYRAKCKLERDEMKKKFMESRSATAAARRIEKLLKLKEKTDKALAAAGVVVVDVVV